MRELPSSRVLWRQVWRWRIVASAFTATTRIGYFLLWVVPSGAVELHVARSDRMAVTLTSLAFALVLAPVAHVHARRQFAPVAEWLDSGRPPEPADQAAVLDQPRRHAQASAAYWAGGGVAAAAIYLGVYSGDLLGATVIALGLTMLGCHASAFVYLGIERRLRPAAAAALVRSQPPRLTVLSVRNRFLLAFALGPGVTIVGIAAYLSLRSSASGVDIGTAIWPAVVLGLLDGYALVALAALSVTEPINEMRHAMRRVVEGDLGVNVGIDASSEVGLLQVGFNRMIDGLRERARYRGLLDQYAGPDVANSLIETGVDFVGTEVDASVVMVDLIGSTPFTEVTPGADVVAALNVFFQTVVQVVADHGGWVNRFVGDAALCVFGAPRPLPDHADRALAAARALQVAIAGLRSERPWLDVAIGISSGTLVAANVGSESRHEFAVVGDAANEASRLTDEAKHRVGRVLASGAALARANDETDWWTTVGEATLRGRSRSTVLFEPLAAVVAEVEAEIRSGRLRPI